MSGSQMQKIAICGDNSLLIECFKALIESGFKPATLYLLTPGLIDWAESTKTPYELITEDTPLDTKDHDLLISCRGAQRPPSTQSTIDHIAYFESSAPVVFNKSPIALNLFEDKNKQSIHWAFINQAGEASPIETASFSLHSEMTSRISIEHCFYAASTTLIKILDYLVEIKKKQAPFHAIKEVSHHFPLKLMNQFDDVKTMDRYIRSLDFGQFPNPHVRPKIVINNQLYFIKSHKLGATSHRSETLSIIDINDSEMVLAGEDGSLIIDALENEAAISIDFKQLKLALPFPYPLKRYESLDTPRSIRALYDASHAETALVKTFSEHTLSQVPYFEHAAASPYPEVSEASVAFDENITADNACACLMSYIAKLNQTDHAFIGFYEPKTDGLEFLVSTHRPILIENIQSKSLNEIASEIKTQRKNKHATGLNDFVARYPSTIRENQRWHLSTLCSFSIDEEAHDNAQLFVNFQTADRRIMVRYFSPLLEKDEQDSIAKSIVKHLEALIDQVIKNPTIGFHALQYLDEDEREKILEMAQGPARAAKYTTLFEYFQQMADRYANNAAIIEGDKTITYEELNIESNKVANYLQAKNISVGSIVALYGDRSANMIIAIYGVLKSGAAYLPIDKKNPPTRTQKILNEAECSYLIYCQEEIESINNRTTQIALTSILSDAPIHTPQLAAKGDDPAYVLFTSGSTGEPKGVIVPERALINFIDTYKRIFSPKPGDITAVISSFAFDGSLCDIFPHIFSGSCLNIAPPNIEHDIIDLVQWINREHITHAFITTPLANLMIKNHEKIRLENSLRLFCGGARLNHYEHAIPNLRLANVYGPTEATCFVSQEDIIAKKNTMRMPSVGKPIENNAVIILDHHTHLLPTGGIGEIYISGVNLSQGYTNPTLQEEKFRLIDINGEMKMCYATGDLARYLPNGSIDFIGRKDTQTKIDGYLVNLIEIKKAVLEHNLINETEIIAKDSDGIGTIICYIAAQKNFNLDQLKQDLKNKLPKFMLPHFYIMLEHLPKSISQKIDITQLLETPKLTIHEKKLIDIISDCLGFDIHAQVKPETTLADIGINSLKRIAITFQIEKTFNIRFSIAALYRHQTIQSLARFIETQNPIGDKETMPEPLESAPLSAQQSNLCEYIRLNPESPAYNISISWCFEAPIDINKLKDALEKLAAQQIGLNLQIDLEAKTNSISQKPIQLEIIDAYSDETDEAVIKKLRDRLFNFSTPPVRFYSLARPSGSIFLMVIHHIIFDDWSLGLLTDSLNKILNSEPIKKPDYNYLNFADRQYAEREDTAFLSRETYWTSALKKVMPLSLSPKNTPLIMGNTIITELGANDINHLNKAAKREGTTLFNLLSVAYAITLSLYTQHENINFCFPYLNRESASDENIIGYFSNLLPLIYQLDNQSTLQSLIQNSHALIEQVIEHNLPFRKIEEISRAHDETRRTLSSILLSYQLEQDTHLYIDQNQSGPARIAYTGTKFELSLSIRHQNNALEISAEYADALFDQATAKAFLKTYKEILKSIAQDSSQTIYALNQLSNDDLSKIIGFEQVDTFALPNISLYQAFVDAADQYSDKLALISDDEHITFKQLKEDVNTQASKIASQLHQKPASIGILITKGPALIKTLLACLKLNIPYLLLNTDFKIESLERLISTVGIQTIICDMTTHNIAEAINCTSINLDTIETDHDQAEPRGKPTILAAFLYTSGTTTQPKVIKLQQSNVLNMALSKKHLKQISETDIVLSTTAVSFDAFHEEVFVTLLNGASLVLTKEKIIPGDHFNQLLLKYGVTHVTCTPILLSQTKPAESINLERIIIGGEALPIKTYNVWKQHTGSMIVGYGVSETCVVASTGLYQKERPSNIGKPIPNVSIYILNEHQQRCPIGFQGYIYIGGDGVTDGYLSEEDQSKGAFTDNPFAPGRLYNTGDIGQWLPDGTILFMGRADKQIKLFGQRIELSAINHLYLQRDDIEAAHAMIQHINHLPSLCLYIVSHKKMNAQQLKQYARENLFPYMVPHYIIQIDSLPITTNGKIDEKKLPLPKNEPSANTEHLDFIESQLYLIWQKLLNTHVEPNTSFFNAGGHSILALQLIDAIEHTFNVSLNFSQLITHDTIHELADIIKAAQSKNIKHSLIQLQTSGKKTPIIFIHPMGGTIFWYLNYARDIEDHPVYAIQDPGIENDLEFSNLEDMAEYYYELIKTELPEGPYILAGASSGSNIAAILSVLMRKRGDQVDALLALDGWLFYPKQLEEEHFLKAELTRQAEALEAKFKDHAIEQSDRWLNLQLKRAKLIEAYEASDIHCPVVLFKATDNLAIFNQIDTEDNYWRTHCKGAFSVVPVPGDHESMHYPPNAEKLLAAIQLFLDQLVIQKPI